MLELTQANLTLKLLFITFVVCFMNVHAYAHGEDEHSYAVVRSVAGAGFNSTTLFVDGGMTCYSGLTSNG